MRPTRDQVMLRIAEIVAERGTCDRKRVGAVIAREGRVISVGYNGAPPGLPHCGENHHGWLNQAQGLEEYGCRNATHAEANALAFAAKYGVSTDGAELFVTVSPCENCARLLIAAGIQAVTFSERYRDEAGIELLRQARIPWYQAHES